MLFNRELVKLVKLIGFFLEWTSLEFDHRSRKLPCPAPALADLILPKENAMQRQCIKKTDDKQ